MTRIPLSILDLAPVTEGVSGAEALRSAVEVAQAAEGAGYKRYWFAEHHLAPGVASSAPAVLSAIVASQTSRIRVGSGAVLLSTTSPLVAAEQFGTISAFHPDRLDLGIGRAFRVPAEQSDGAQDKAVPPARTPAAKPQEIKGITFPKAPHFPNDSALRERLLAEKKLLSANRQPAPFAQEVDLILDLQAGKHTDNDGRDHSSPAVAGSDFELYILASSGGESATVAALRGLPLVANYHVSPATTLDTVRAYRENFTPGVLPQPYVIVSADVLVADSHERAQELATPYAEWVLSIRSGRSGAAQYRTPAQAVQRIWAEAEKELVEDRVLTRFVGTAESVTHQLEALAEVTDADELLITTIAHTHIDRLRSVELLAAHWNGTRLTESDRKIADWVAI